MKTAKSLLWETLLDKPPGFFNKQTGKKEVKRILDLKKD